MYKNTSSYIQIQQMQYIIVYSNSTNAILETDKKKKKKEKKIKKKKTMKKKFKKSTYDQV